jgi:AcrR family transcriptional regulator
MSSLRGRRVSRPTGEDRERAILATAERLLAVRSVNDISIDDLARGAGISRPTFYFYFPSKEAVVLALLDRVAEEARSVRGRALEEAGDDVPELWRRGLLTIVDTFRAHRSVTLAVSQMIPGSVEAQKLWARITEGFVEDIQLGIDSERARGAAPPGLPSRQLAVVLHSMTERVYGAALAGQEPCLGEEEAVDVLLSVWSRAIYGDDSLGAGRRTS